MASAAKRRVALVHWNAEEAAERAERLEAAGFAVAAGFADGAKALAMIKEAPPDAILIDLTRLPSHGREIAQALRQAKATRRLPLVFVAGDPEKVAKIRALLPDATFTSWARVGTAMRAAIARPSLDPVVPKERDAGYSGTPLP